MLMATGAARGLDRSSGECSNHRVNHLNWVISQSRKIKD